MDIMAYYDTFNMLTISIQHRFYSILDIVILFLNIVVTIVNYAFNGNMISYLVEIQTQIQGFSQHDLALTVLIEDS